MASSTPVFRDVTKQAGITFVHQNGATGQYGLEEIIGGGGGFLDYDGDGWLDIYLVQSHGGAGATSQLYRNTGEGGFEDVTATSGAGVSGYGMGCTAADYDSDGDVDLYVTRLGCDVLLENNGQGAFGAFSDVTESAGLCTPGWSTAATFLDVDRDGDLDLYVARYVDVDVPSRPVCADVGGERDYCKPTNYRPTSDRLYLGDGTGRFVDISAAAGIDAQRGYGLGLLSSDFDGDGWVDIYVANDQSPAFLWRNQGDGTFKETGLLSGAAFSGDGQAIAGMGTAAADFDSDGDLDLLVMNIRHAPHLFLRNEGGLFDDVTASWGELRWTVPYTGFGVGVFDQDLDGLLDLFIANGAVIRARSPLDPGQPYAEPNQFMRQTPGGTFVDQSAVLESAGRQPAVSRALACGDYDNDGDIDVLIVRSGAAAQLLRNEQQSGGHWLIVEPLQDGPTLNTRVSVRRGAQRWIREVCPHQSYLSSHDPRVHFGLGADANPLRVTLRWPDGARETWRDIDVDQMVRLVRGTGEQL